MSKKILIHTLVFSPDGVSTAYLYNDIALKFKEKGFEVVVLTTTPHYNLLENELKKQPLKRKLGGVYFESNFNGIKVKHVYQKKFKSTFLRLISFIHWHIITFFLALKEKNVDCILSPSPPLTLGFINVILGKLKSSKVIYNVQEIYPDLLIEEGGLKSKPIVSLLKKMERFVYNKSDLVTTIDNIFYNTIQPRFKKPSKLHIIPNFVDTEIYFPIAKESLKVDENLFPPTQSLKLMYAGNVGYAQDWTPLISLAKELKDEPIEIFVIGEGVMKSYLVKEKSKYNLEKLHLIPYQQREIMPQLLAYSDLQFIFMNKQTEDHGFPSKVYTIMACAKPLLVCSGNQTPIVNFLQDKDCAFLFTNENKNEKIAQITSLLKNISRDKLVEMGQKGFEHIENTYSKRVVTEKYVELVENLITP